MSVSLLRLPDFSELAHHNTLAVFLVSTTPHLLRRVELAVPACGLPHDAGEEPVDGERRRGVVRGEAPVVLKVVGGRDEEARHEPC